MTTHLNADNKTKLIMENIVNLLNSYGKRQMVNGAHDIMITWNKRHTHTFGTF